MTTPMPSMSHPVPQPVLTPLTPAAIVLVLRIEDGGESAVRDALESIAGVQRAIGFRYPDDGLETVVGIGSDAWDRLFSGPRPAQLHPLPEIAGATHTAVSTEGDLLLHIRAQQLFLCWEMARQLMVQMRGRVSVVDETFGFRYFDRRDLLGFVDGTENPPPLTAYEAVTVTPEQDAAFAGSSYVIVQKYLHDLDAWGGLSVEQQEHAVGRTKLEDIELPDDVKPDDSHVALNTVPDENGDEPKIVRDNMPFGSFREDHAGTYFIGYTRDPAVIERMLRHMFVGVPEGSHDRLLDVSTAVTGTTFFVPTADFLDELPPAPGD